MDLDKIKQIAYDNLSQKKSRPNTESGNKYYHGQRVAITVLELRNRMLPDDTSHDEVLTVAAWFHDIMNGTEHHAQEGARVTRELLDGYISENELKEITEIIAVHDARSPQDNTYSDYVKLQQDADLLDHFGIFDIWRSFQYFTAKGYSLQHAHDYYKNEQIDNAKIDRELLNYDISKKIFDEKMCFIHQFTERLKYEGVGKIFDFEKLI